MAFLRRYIFPLLIFLILTIIFSYKLFYSFNFHPDFARDIYDILSIVQGKFSLIGPKLSFGGFYSGPFYYYLFAPIFYISRLNPNSLLIMNVFFFSAAPVIFYLLAQKKDNHFSVFLSSLIIGLSPIYITSSRGPWNGSTYLPFLLVFMSWLYFNDFNGRRISLIFLGFLGGFIGSIHFVSLGPIFIAFAYLWFILKDKRYIVFFLLGFVLAFSPLLIFEVRHGFIMTKNTFIVGSYKTFVENNNIPNAVSGKKNFLANIFFLGDRLSAQIGINIFLFMGTLIFGLMAVKKNKEKIFPIMAISLFLFYALILRYQFGSHYLFPITILFLFILVNLLIKTRYKIILLLLLVLELFSFPKNIYSKSGRTAGTYETRVMYVIKNNLISKTDSFNIVQISKDYGVYVPVGHEYRFFFKKNGYNPKSETEYSSSNILLIFSEIKNFDIKNLSNWEVGQFGIGYLSHPTTYQIDGSVLYLIKK